MSLKLRQRNDQGGRMAVSEHLKRCQAGSRACELCDMTRPFRFLALCLLAAFAVAYAASSTAATTDCVRDGGMAICTAPILAPLSPTVTSDADFWSYSLCENEPPYLRSAAIW